MSTRTLTTTLLAVIGLFALVAIWYSLGHPGWSKPLPDLTTYKSGSYGYSFSYPRTLELAELTGRRVAVGTLGEGEFDEQVVVSVARGEEGVPSGAAFLRQQATKVCTDPESGKRWCNAPTAEREFQNGSSLLITEFTVPLQAATGASATSTAPGQVLIYAIDITSLRGGGSPTAILIYPPVYRTDTTYNTELVESIAQSLVLGG